MTRRRAHMALTARRLAAMLGLGVLLGLPGAARGQLPLPPTSPQFVAVTRLDQEGYGDSARAVIARLLAKIPPTDSSYPEALYTAATVARSGTEMRLGYSTVAVEYSTSAWADKAQLRLAQLDFGAGNTDDVVTRVTKLFNEYPASPVLPNAALWGAKAEFEHQHVPQACGWLTRGIAVVGDDVELKNQLLFYKQRCNVGPGVELAPPVVDSLRSKDSSHTAPPKPASAGNSKPAPAGAKSGPKIADHWRIQVAAIVDKAVITRLVQKIEAAGFKSFLVTGPRGLTEVQAGPFATRADAVAQLAKVKAAVGGSAFVTATPP